MYHFCTISTVSHLFKTYALAETIRKQGFQFVLHVLVIDGDGFSEVENCRFWGLKQMNRPGAGEIILSKYRHNKDKLRWALKPVFLHYLISEADIDKIIYVDNDLFFCNDYTFLFEYLSEHSFILTPHYYKTDPKKEQNWLEANFRVGMFNAGFAGVNKKAEKSLKWWADCCAYRCEKNSFRGLFDDQKYLDMIPLMEESALIVRHKGCNVAGWNLELCDRQDVGGTVLIEGKYPVIFIHFTSITASMIEEGEDPLLQGYYTDYLNILRKYNPGLDKNELFRPLSVWGKLKYFVWQIADKIG
jgi:hypothetical protein